MNSVHDMGGLQGFGPVLPEAREPVFHAHWERRALAVTLAMGATGRWTIDHSRAAREALPPAVYLGSSYYEIWLAALENLLRERGLATAEELADGRLRQPGSSEVAVLHADQIAPALARGSSAERAPPAQHPTPRFVPGDRVRALNMHPSGHTRLPRYVRGHVGTVEAVRGCHVFPDTHSQGLQPPFDETAHWLYTVVFDATALWGPQADAHSQVSVDAWEPYLEPCPSAA